MNPISSSATATLPFLNVSSYKFVPLDGLEVLRAHLQETCEALELRGTILLSKEGINLFLSGRPNAVQKLLSELRRDPRLADLETKDSYSEEPPFRRMLVRLKKEIIAFGEDDIRPAVQTSPKLAPQKLKQWLDAGRPVRLLDVRNEYEIELGTFRGAEHLQIDNFRNFPKAVKTLPEEAKREPLVMFCTGGIRCEKAGPYLEQVGFEQVYQLDGGILKYFELCGGAHYDGACFVFDGRVALDSELKPTGNLLCFACQAVLQPTDIESDKFLFGKYCPHCYRDPDALMADRVRRRQRRIDSVAGSQPGSVPYTNLRRMYVPRRHVGRTLLEFLQYWHPPTSNRQWLQWIEAGEITLAGEQVSADFIVRDGQQFDQQMPGTIEPPINPEIQLLYEDTDLVVVNKPAPLPVHPSGRYNRNTLTSILAQAYPKEKLRPAHRLDAATTGVVLLCRRLAAARVVQPQFQQGRAVKRYLCRVHGRPAWTRSECDAAVGRQATEGGARKIDPHGLAASTQFRVLREFPDDTTLVEAIPRTGRTHQIRLHAWHLGHPVVGDPLYRLDSCDPEPSPAEVRMCLHAAEIGFLHPSDHRPVRFVAPAPQWASR